MFPATKLLLLLSATLLSSTAVQALWPLPRNWQKGNSTLVLSPSFKIEMTGSGNVASDVWDAISRTEGYLKYDKLGRLVVGRGSSDAWSFKSAHELCLLNIYLGNKEYSISTEAKWPMESRDESYWLWVPEDGSAAELKANSSLGLFRGLTTFSQLWYTYENTIYAIEQPTTIDDMPAFPYRGFALDTARHYFPVDVIKRQLDAMSWVKMSQFHWHIVDSQSFPLVVPGYETISQYGAYSAWDVYTQQDVYDIVAYAAARGIDVLVEIDTPGHTAAISYSYPEHIACPQSTPWATYANEPPAGQLRLASANTTAFTAGLLSAVSDMFPSNYFSTGGDEINLYCYTHDPQTQAELNATGETFEQALSKFTQYTHQAIIKKGKTPVVWEEMVLAHNVTLSNDTIVMVWISSQDALGVADRGFRIVHSPSNFFYLDCGAGGWVGNNTNGNSWCDPFKTWQMAYSFDPYANLTSSQYHLVLGGQQLLWTEQSSPNNVDPIVWPRAAASAELFWSGPGGNSDTALPRLHDISFRMDRRGIYTIPLQPLWCALRPYACDLTA